MPRDFGNPFLFTYLMPPNSGEMVSFVDHWLTLRKADGFRERDFTHWILGRPRAERAPRWSILRSVLHWAPGD